MTVMYAALPTLLACGLFMSPHQWFSWSLSCKQYREVVEQLYKDPYLSRAGNKKHRESIHAYLRSRTPDGCLSQEPFR